MNTLEVTKENALKAYDGADKKGKALLTNLLGEKVFQRNIRERIKTFEDVCKEMGKDPKDYNYSGNDPDDFAANALRMWLLILRCFNEGKEADWSDSSQYKYAPWMKFSPVSGWSLHVIAGWRASADAGARLVFLDRKNAEYCMENDEFRTIYLNYFQ